MNDHVQQMAEGNMVWLSPFEAPYTSEKNKITESKIVYDHR